MSRTSPADTTQTIAQPMLSVFATPIVNLQLPSLLPSNEELLSLILELRQTDSGLDRSNVGGWHSNMRFLDRDDTCIRFLREALTHQVQELSRAVAAKPNGDAYKQFRIEGWANVLGYGDYNSVHCHPNAFWSGVYYVTGNTPSDERPFSGKLELVDPRPGASVSFAEHTSLYGRIMLSPTPGQLIVFPGWLQHQVHPHFGSEPRVSIAFNVLF